jgi:hypothetical protein
MMSGRHLSGSMRSGSPGTSSELSACTRTISTSSAIRWPRIAPLSSAIRCEPARRASSWIGHSRARGGATTSDGTGVRSARSNLCASCRYPRCCLVSGTGSLAVVSASRSTSGHRCRRQVQHALAGAEDILRCCRSSAEAKHAAPTQPPRGGHRRQVRAAVRIEGTDEHYRRAEVENCRVRCGQHGHSLWTPTTVGTPKFAAEVENS